MASDIDDATHRPTASDISSRGLFSEHLPPCITAASFGKFIEAAGSSPSPFGEEQPSAQMGVHNLPRPGGTVRPLGIPNPISFHFLAKEVADSWDEILPQTRSQFSVAPIAPQAGTRYRALLKGKDWGTFRDRRAQTLRSSRFILRTDIARFYPSVYTHAIPWSLHSRTTAKRRRRDQSLLGNRLDCKLRACQDDQTLGVPIGPDTSHLVAELLLSRVEEDAFKENPPIGCRFVDDYIFAADSLADAENIRTRLQTSLLQFGLALNEAKTEVLEAPYTTTDQFFGHIRRAATSQQHPIKPYDLEAYFDVAFRLAKQVPHRNVLGLAISELRELPIPDSIQPLLWNLVAHAIRARPGCLRHALKLHARGFNEETDLYSQETGPMEHNQEGSSIERFDLSSIYSEVLSAHLGEHATLGHGNEAAWTLWASASLGCALSPNALKAAAEMRDPVVAAMLFHGRREGRFSVHPDWLRLSSEDQEGRLAGSNWIFHYETIGSKDPSSTVGLGSDRHTDAFLALAESNVSFVDFQSALHPETTSEGHAPEDEPY